jgi:TusA-related sulfurtransferase
MASKYDETFAKMQPGQCVKTTPENTGNVANSMRKWIEKNGKKEVLRVRIASKMPDGFGRVWMMHKKPMKMEDVPGRKIEKLGR